MASRAIEEIRKRLLSQADIARAVGVTPQAVSEWMTSRSVPSAKTMVQLENLLGVPMRLWFEHTQDEEK